MTSDTLVVSFCEVGSAWDGIVATPHRALLLQVETRCKVSELGISPRVSYLQTLSDAFHTDRLPSV